MTGIFYVLLLVPGVQRRHIVCLLFTVSLSACMSVSALLTEQESVCNATTVTKRLCLSVCLSVH